jgi:hypothetical protein
MPVENADERPLPAIRAEKVGGSVIKK